jgi:zinc transport system substrate-binding protein
MSPPQRSISAPAKWLSSTSQAITFLMLGLLIGCGSSSPPSTTVDPNSPTPGAESPSPKLRVMTTFLPMTQFTRAVAGDRAEVTQLLPAGAEPHDYQAKPEDVQRLAKAQVLITNGLGIENFLERTLSNAANPNLRIVDTSQGIATLKSEPTSEHGSDHAYDHGPVNPHIWLDPKRVIRQVETIRDALIVADPQGKAVYTANAARFISELKTLDADITTSLKPYRGKTFIAYHDFAPYFAQSYNLKAEFLVNVPEEKPSPADVKRVIQTAQASQLKTLLAEPSVGPEAFAAVAQDLNVRISIFNSLETGDTEAMAPQTYLQTMRQNLQNLKSAFQRNTTQSDVGNGFGLAQTTPFGQPMTRENKQRLTRQLLTWQLRTRQLTLPGLVQPLDRRGM